MTFVRKAASGRLFRSVAVGLLFLLLPACVHFRAGSEKRPLLSDVEFLGNEKIPAKALAAAVQSQKTSLLPFTAPFYLDADVATTDMERLERFYRSRGFYQAEVRSWRIARSHEERVSLGFVINEGPRTRVREISVVGLEELPEADRKFVTRGLPLKKGVVVTEEAYDFTKRIIEDRLRMRGYAFAEVEGEVRVYPDRNMAEVTYAAAPGKRFRFGKVTIVGNDDVSQRPILWAASAIEPGSRYDERDVDEAQGDVYDLGVFRAVNVEIQDPVEGSDRLPVIVHVRETPLQGVEVGVGGGADQASQRARTRATWRHKNLFGGLDLIETTARAGYAVVPGIVDPFHDGPIWGGEATFRRPNFVLRNHVLSSRASYDHDIEAAYDVDSARATVGVDRDVSWYGVGAAYGLELYQLRNFRLAPAALDENKKARPDRCPEPCIISFVEPHAWIDRRDDVVQPRHGWHASLRLEKGGGPLGGTHEYVKASPEVRGYLTPSLAGSRWTLAGRGKLGWLLPQSGESPSVRRFFGGGPDSHRGYAVRRLSPMAAAKGAGTVPIGGDYLVETSGEARFHITGNFSGAAFVDAAQVGFDERRTFAPENLAIAIGPGIRYATPIGPVRFDIGYRLRAPDQRTIDVANEAVNEPLWAFHLGIGEAF